MLHDLDHTDAPSPQEGAAGALGETEPLGAPFSIDALTRHAALMSPDASQVHARFGSAAAAVTLTPQPTGIVERAEVYASARPTRPRPTRDALREWAEVMHREGATFGLLDVRTVTAEGNLMAARYISAPLALMADARRFPHLSPLELARHGALHIDGDVMAIFYDEDDTLARQAHTRTMAALLARDTWARTGN